MSLNQRQLHFTSPGLRSRVVDIASNAIESETKRFQSIYVENIQLDHNIVELDEGTKARNRSFQERIDEVWSLTSGWEAKLKTEAIESVESILNLKAEYQKHIEIFEASFFSDIKSIFDKFDEDLLPKQDASIVRIEKDMQHFYKDLAPPAIQAQAGEVNRQLRKTYETFHIEQQKELKRDKKLVNRVNKYWQHTAQRFNDEGALQDACFYNLEDDIIDAYRPYTRMLSYHMNTATESILSLRKIMNDTIKIRCDEDLDVLDTVIETQQLLQQIVILYFGIEHDDAYENQREQQILERIKFPKLTQRLLLKSSSTTQPSSDMIDDVAMIDVAPAVIIDETAVGKSTKPTSKSTSRQSKKPTKSK